MTSGIMVPLVDTAEQAERIVSFTRYPPKGRRGAAFGFAHDDFQGGDVIEKMRAIHERTLVICMIETRAGLDNVEAIAAVDGVDVVWLGHFDLTNFLGIPGEFSSPRQALIRQSQALDASYGRGTHHCRFFGKHLIQPLSNSAPQLGDADSSMTADVERRRLQLDLARLITLGDDNDT